MLDFAIRHRNRLQDRYLQTIDDPRFKFYHRSPAMEYSLPIYPDSWEWVQLVSLTPDGDVGGYFGARLNRLTKTAYDMEMINFNGRNEVFTADLFSFIDTLFCYYGMNRLVWNVIAGNPAERLYDRLTVDFGGRVIGVFKQDVMLSDGQLYSVKWYEAFKEDYYRELNRMSKEG